MGENEKKTVKKNGSRWLVKALKCVGIAAGVVVGLLLLACSLIVWILTPAKLTPMVEQYASEYLNADITAGRVELTFWHTFPRMTLDVDSLCVVSRSLAMLPDSVKSQLPADADSLLQLRHFHGGVNVASLGEGKLALYDVIFEGAKINAVQVNDSVANYLIMPADSIVEVADTAAFVMPFSKIGINRFAITDASPIRFRSLADTLDVALNLHEVSLTGHEAPLYRCGLAGNVQWDLLREYNFENLALGLQGTVNWDLTRPSVLAVEGLAVSVDSLDATIDADVDFNGAPVLGKLKVATGYLPVARLLRHLPADGRAAVDSLETDMTVQMAMTLTEPWVLTDTLLPSFEATLAIPQCEATFQGRHFNELAAELHADFKGNNLDASTFAIDKLIVDGECIDIDLRGTATNVVTDPMADGRFKGAIDLSRLPPRLRALIPAEVHGVLEGETTFRLRMSDLSREHFHRMLAKGEIRLRDFSAGIEAEKSALYVRNATLNFGSNTAFVNDAQQKVDSLLTVSLKVDTISAQAPGIDFEARGLRAGAGTVNRSSSRDTTEINPFGMTFAIERLKMDLPDDTMRLRLHGTSVAGSLRRYKGEARLPQMNFRLGLKGLMLGQSLNMVALRDASMDVDLHMRKPHRRDSLSAKLREGRPAPIDTAMRRGGGASAANSMFALDVENRRLLRRWDFSGSLHAKSGRLVTPSFPLRNRLSNIDLHFNQDSIMLKNLHCKAGQSDFEVHGAITNLRRALTARRNNTLGVSFVMLSDTINVNEIVRALFAGGAMAQSADSAMVWNDAENGDATFEQQADTSAMGPLLVPRNIDVKMAMRARNILYSDLVLNSFKGDLLVYDGAINLRRLQAATDIGSINLDGLYTASHVDSLQFGLGMKVSNFRLDRFSSIVPAIDSLLPAMRSFAGTVNAEMAVTTNLSQQMDVEIPSLRAAIKIEGDSLVLLDADTFKSLSKWLMFKNKNRNLIDHMAVEVTVENSQVEIFPFMFDIDRYRLGVMGSNDLAMNMDYHVSVLKSPIPFKFGINIKGTPDKYKIRLGGAKIKDNMVVERQAIADNTRVNIVQQIDDLFRRGISNARRGRLTFSPEGGAATEEMRRNRRMREDLNDETISAADSLRFIREGLIEKPDSATLEKLNRAVAPVGVARK